MKEKSKKDKKNKVSNENIVKFIKDHEVVAYTIIGITIYILISLLTAQMKTISRSEEVSQGKREKQLVEELTTLKEQYDDLKKEYEDKKSVLENYQNNAANNDTLISAMKEEITSLSLAAGVKDVYGEGIIITLNDGTSSTGVEDVEDLIVHDSDILTVVNELKAAGAEAISVNGNRIIANSSIRCVGPVIQVNYQKVAAPFIIKAIGNAQYLESAMNIKSGIADILKNYGVQVDIKRDSNIKILAYDGTISFKNAKISE